MFPVLAGSNPSGYNLTRSLRFRASASAYLSRTPASTSNQKTWTWSGWVKRGTLGQSGGSTPYFFVSSSAGTDAAFFACGFNGDALTVTGYATNYLTTSAVYRDPASWYHVVIAVDTTQATTSNRIKVYVNGSQVTAFSTANYVAQNFNTPVNLNQAHYHCAFNVGSGVQNFNDLYLEEVNFVDGLQLTPSSFGSINALTGVWQPARYAGTYGTNGFYLPFTDNSALTTSSNVGLGKDFSGNGNYWTTNNISITAGVTYDSMTDVPTLTSATAANYAVLNPLSYDTGTYTISNANLTFAGSRTATGAYFLRSTIAMTSGKYYWEITPTDVGAGPNIIIGIQDATVSATSGTSGFLLNGYGYYAGGTKYSSGSSATAYGASWTNGDVIGVAFDATAGTLTFYKNNTSQGTAFTGITGSYVPVIDMDVGGIARTIAGSVNFGQRPFTYTPPTGFVALNTYNLPTSTILKGNKVMDATLYTGTGAAQTITNAGGFKPDLVWQKSRSGAYNHGLNDSNRGAGKFLYANLTDAEGNYPTDFASFNSNGFSLGTGTGNVTNSNGATYVAWQWQAGQGSTSSNTSGTITSTVSVNASAGFSVVTYTGTGANATVGHGLGVAPSMVIVKQRNATQDWMVGSSALTSWNQYLILNAVQQAAGSTTVWNDTAPTSSVFSLGNSATTNGNTNTYVAYCWAPISGYSSIGKYTGNGVAAGTFVYTGFQPKFILIKSSSTTYAWFMEDSARNVYNGISSILQANSSAAEITGTTYNIDFLSNGFKLATPQGNINGSGDIFIYMAFASNPFKNSLAF